MTVEEGFGEEKGVGNNILVGIQFDADSRELLAWALTKIAEPCDHVIAVHVDRASVLCSKENSAATSCLTKSLYNYLAVYEGLCRARKVDLVGKVSHGSSIRKVLVREAKLCTATTVIVGISKHNALRGSLSLARYCAKWLPPATRVLTINNGKVVFQKDATTQLPVGLQREPRPRLRSILHPSLSMDVKVIIPSHKEDSNIGISTVMENTNGIPHTVSNSKIELINDSGHLSEIAVEQDSPIIRKDDTKLDEDETGSLSSSAFQSTVDMESTEEAVDDQFNPPHEPPAEETSSSVSRLIKKPQDVLLGWPLLRKASLASSEALKEKEARTMSVVEWVMHLPNRSLPSTPEPQICMDKFQNPIGRVISMCRGTNSKKCLSTLFKIPEELETILISNSSGCRWFTHYELQSSTNQFSQENLIGKGGCSQVYKGSLPNGQHVAIKIMKSSKEAWKDFLLEVDIITSLQHKSVLPLIGVCVEHNNLISVYDFLSNGSLEENLHGKGEKSVLPWAARYRVALGVAEALSYLHSDCSRPIIHRDVKSSNILLSDKFEPKLNDFGLAIVAPTSNVTHGDVVGTFGYIAPEYFMYGKVSDKIDVYSYGVVLLELLSGRKPISTENPEGQVSLVMWATPILESGVAADLMDQNLGGEFDENQMHRMVLAASLCIKRTARHRPRMSQIVKLLRGEEGVMDWVLSQVYVPKEIGIQDEEEYPAPSMQSHHLGLALLDREDDSGSSVSSIEQSNHRTMEEYLRERISC